MNRIREDMTMMMEKVMITMVRIINTDYEVREMSILIFFLVM